MNLKDYDLSEKSLQHFKFKSNLMKLDITDLDDGGAIYSITSKIAAGITDTTDKTIMDAIVRAAEENGVSDLYILDKQFVFDAIREKMERERRKNGQENL